MSIKGNLRHEWVNGNAGDSLIHYKCFKTHHAVQHTACSIGKSKVGNHPKYDLIHILSNSLSAVESAQGISDYPNK